MTQDQKRTGGDRTALVPDQAPGARESDPGIQEGILRGELFLRLLEDGSSGTWGHPVVATVTLLLFWGRVEVPVGLGWFFLVLFATIGRVLLTRKAKRLPDDPDRGRNLVLAGVVAVALAWGLGGILFGTRIPSEELGFLLVIMAGLVAAGSATLVADRPAFYAFATLLLGSVFASVFLRGLDQLNVLLLLLVVAFWTVMVFIHGKAQDQLVESLRIRKELRDTQGDYEDLVESAHDLVWRVDGQGRWTFLNASARDIYGASPGELLGTKALDRADGEHRDADYAAFARVLMGGDLIDHETVHHTIEGEERFLSFSARPLRDAQGEIRGAQGTARDVTDNVRARRALEEVAKQNSLVQSLINATSDLIFYKDAHGTYQGCNVAFSEFYGVREEEIVGGSDEDFVGPDRAQAYRASDQEAMKSSDPIRFEEWIEDDDGRRRLMETVKTVYRAPGGETLGILGVVRDVTERKEAEERMRELAERAAHATRMKSAFLANMSHEIRTPMNGVLGMTEILLETQLNEEQRQSLEIIRDSGEALLGVLNDILDISKIEAGHLELEHVSFDLHETVMGAAQIFTHPATKRGNELVIDIRPEVPRGVRGDPTRLRQVLSNLVGNAVKFTQDGEILLSVSKAEEAGESRIRFSVKDTGVGIPEEQQEAIFQEFTQADSSTTRQYGGTGLGLTISRHLVSIMGGELNLESKEGEGSDFFFVAELPEDEGFLPEEESTDPVDLRNMKALVVDDLETNRRIFAEFMESAGASVRVASGAEEAFTLLREALDFDPFHFAVLDVLMPGRDGFQLAEDIRLDPELRDLPLLILTSSNRPGDRKLATRLRVDGFLHKPISRPSLLRAVAAVFRRRRSGEAAVGAEEGQLVTDEPRHRQLSIPPEDSGKRERERPPSSAASGPASGLKVLLAEDNMVNQQVAMALLERWGCEARAVTTGRGVLDTLEDWVPDLILMDVQMPELDGLEATRRIRQDPRFGDIPILALTAHALAEERSRCRDAGMDDYLAKPFRPEELEEKVNRWASRRRSIPESPAGDGTAGTVPQEEVESTDEGATHLARDPEPVLLDAFRESMREAGIESVVDAAVEIYLQETPRRMQALEEAVASGEAGRIESEAHGMKSGSRNIRADVLGGLLESVERDAREGKIEEAILALPQVKAEFERVMEFLKEKGFQGG